jgi:hypothetical protein
MQLERLLFLWRQLLGGFGVRNKDADRSFGGYLFKSFLRRWLVLGVGECRGK